MTWWERKIDVIQTVFPGLLPSPYQTGDDNQITIPSLLAISSAGINVRATVGRRLEDGL
jgi:hypothetical protein